MSAKGSFNVKPGMTGWLVSCFKSRERQTQKELLAFLEPYFDDPVGRGSTASSDKSNFSKELQEELDGLSAPTKRRRASQPQNVSLGDLACLVFICFPDAGPSPLDLAYSVWKEIQMTGKKSLSKSQRVTPIERTCLATLANIEAEFLSLMEQHDEWFCPADYVPKREISYTSMPSRIGFEVFVESRHHSSVSAAAIKETLSRAVLSRWCSYTDENSEILSDLSEPFARFKVDLTAPRLSVVIQIMKNICGLAVLTDYRDVHRKGNLQCLYDRFVETNVRTASITESM